MPIYAYRCRDCGQEFETLVMPGETPLCQACDSEDLDAAALADRFARKGRRFRVAPETCDAMGGCACAGMRAVFRRRLSGKPLDLAVPEIVGPSNLA